jgi:WhiB family redox-sensing transcriptional regulator
LLKPCAPTAKWGEQSLASPTGYRTRIRALDTRHSSVTRSTTMDWRDKSACLTVDPELFFPVGNTGPAVEQIEKAKAVCARCTVTEVCLQYALETGQDSGVWGGLSEDERRALKRRAARARRAS